MALSYTDIVALIEKRATTQYGRESVSQMEHALQCAHLSELAGESDESIVAALLHDFGHLLAAENEGVADVTLERDDLHQYVALPFLRGALPNAVLEPIRMHVDAKRYLCGAEPDYWASLSDASKHSLELQGGAFQATELVTFISQPYAKEAVRLRRYDDLAKVPGKPTPHLGYFASKLQLLMHNTRN